MWLLAAAADACMVQTCAVVWRLCPRPHAYIALERAVSIDCTCSDKHDAAAKSELESCHRGLRFPAATGVVCKHHVTTGTCFGVGAYPKSINLPGREEDDGQGEMFSAQGGLLQGWP